ncbi:MAG: helix-turn-helix transcriptional regulator [Phycisphaeraceae bacterium]|nr:helix-turn-helix transcriptional regulator [Phycisphaeraceae bacterium]
MREVETLRTLRRNIRVFAALGDQTRLSILSRLGRGEPMSIARLTTGRRVTRQSISKHLRILSDAGLVYSVRHGRESRYAIKVASLDDAGLSLDRLSKQWDVALLRLKASVERKTKNAG